jgi:hypothetical protein
MPTTLSVRSHPRRILCALASLLVASTVLAPGARAEPAAFAGASANGEIILFTTSEKLVPGDTDNKRDVYERFFDSSPGIESYVTREVSTGPTGGNDAHDVNYDGVSEDGSKVFFSTAESLVAEDTDLSVDIYVRDLGKGTTTLVSKPGSTCATPNCGNAPLPADFNAVSGSGDRVVFSTAEQLGGEDEDSVEDLYVRDLTAKTTTLVSKASPSCAIPNCGNGSGAAFFDAASADALTVAFSSKEPLTEEDEDTSDDIYVREIGFGQTRLATQEGICPPLLPGAACAPIFGGISSDGSHLFFESEEQLGGGDSDELQDVYAWSGGSPTLISTGTATGPAANATYSGTSANGADAFFETSERLSAGDLDSARDIYERSGGATTLISTGPAAAAAGLPAAFERVTADGAVVLFTTAEKLTAEDEDSNRDVYSRAVGPQMTTLVSRAGSGCTGACGNGSFDATFAGLSADGSDAFFETDEALVAADTDNSVDVYERSGSVTSLVSTGPMSKNGVSDPHLTFVSNDGAHAVLTTEERLTIDDLDTETDVYDHSSVGTLLVSTRNPDELVLGPAVPALTGVTPVSPDPSTEPRILGQGDFESLIKIYSTADCSGIPAATGTAAELESGGIPVVVVPGSTTTFHATATFLNDTSACSTDAVTYQQVAEGAGGGGGTGGGGGASGGGEEAPKISGPKPAPITIEQHLIPQTRITFAPGAKTHSRRPVFQFVDSTGQGGTKFFCKIDRASWRFCSSPLHLKRQSPGRHVFGVKGMNSGLMEKVAVTRKFKVVAR